MGTYNEPRVPQGAPVDGEHDVWLADGKVKFGHYVSASSSWVVDREEGYDGGTTMADSWHIVGNSGEPSFSTTGWGKAAGGSLLKYKLVNGVCHITGVCVGLSTNTSGYLFVLPTGYRPSDEIHITGVIFYNVDTGVSTPITVKVYPSGQIDCLTQAKLGHSLTFNNLWFAV